MVGTIADLRVFGAGQTGHQDIVYSAALDNYFVSSREAIYRFDPAGQLVQTYQSALLDTPTGLLVVPEPPTYVLALLGLLTVVVAKLSRERMTTCSSV